MTKRGTMNIDYLLYWFYNLYIEEIIIINSAF